MAEIRAANKAMMALKRVEEKRLAALVTAQQEQRRQQILRRQDDKRGQRIYNARTVCSALL